MFSYAVVAVILPQSFGAEIGQETLLFDRFNTGM